MSVTVLVGENSFLLQAELQHIIADFVQQYDEFGVEQLDGEETEYDKIRQASESLPFLVDKKLVVVRNASANKEFLENAPKLLQNIPESVDFVLTDVKLDKRTAFYKYVSRKTNYKQFPELDNIGLAKWAVLYVADSGGELSFNDARYLVERVGSKQRLISNELEKLIAYDSKITKSTINMLTDLTPQGTIFELMDAALAGKSKQVIGMYKTQRQMRIEPLYILSMLTWQLHILAIVKTAGSKTAEDIARQAKINPYVVKKAQSVIGRISRQQLHKMVAATLETDITLKSQSIDADQAMMQLLMDISDN